MVQKGERIPCVMFEDNSVELFHDFESARFFADLYIGTQQIIGVESFGPNCKTITFIDHNGTESFVTISFKVVG